MPFLHNLQLFNLLSPDEELINQCRNHLTQTNIITLLKLHIFYREVTKYNEVCSLALQTFILNKFPWLDWKSCHLKY